MALVRNMTVIPFSFQLFVRVCENCNPVLLCHICAMQFLDRERNVCQYHDLGHSICTTPHRCLLELDNCWLCADGYDRMRGNMPSFTILCMEFYADCYTLQTRKPPQGTSLATRHINFS